MKKSLICLAAFASMTPLSTGIAFAKTPATSVSRKVLTQQQVFAAQVLAADKSRNAAMVKIDIKALAPLLADDLTYTRSTGVVQSKSGFLDEVKNAKMRYRQIEVKQTTVRIYGDTAILNGTAFFKLVRYGKEEDARAVFTSVYVRNRVGSQRRWQLAAWQSNFIPTKKVLDHIKNYNKNNAPKAAN